MTTTRMLTAIQAIDDALEAVSDHDDMNALTGSILGLAAASYRGDVGREYATREDARVAFVLAAADAWDRIDADADAYEAVNTAGGGRA